MSAKNGQLLVSRQQITLDAGANTIDTGLRQVNLSFGASSVGEPDLAARTMVIPLPAGVGPGPGPSPFGIWADVVVSAEPTIGPGGTVLVELTWNGEGGSAIFNVLFWAPHTSIGPVDAAPYLEA
jgi:hypothetical protein